MATRRINPLSLLLCSLLFFCTQAYAVSAVLGVDLGTEYIKAALVKPGIPLEIVLTKDSRRKETSAVTFKPSRGGAEAGAYPERVYGSDAMALAARFPGDVYPNLKVLLGLPVDGNAVVQEYAARHPALKLEAHPVRKTAAFKSGGAFSADEDVWLVEELMAMELDNVARNAAAMAGPDTSVSSVVITVPPFYTTEEKRAVELAADLAGLRVLSLISDGLAVGLNYATSRQFPNVNDGGKPEINMVFDMGAGSTKATIIRFQSRSVKDVGKFSKTVQEAQVLSTGWDRTLGGDALNAVIIDDMVAQFVDSPGAKAAGLTAEQVLTHGRTMAKLSKEAERIRHVLSANINTAASFEGLHADVDFRYKISRAEFEAMVEAAAARVAAVVQQALDVAGLQTANLDSVILHGGATRTPFVQKQLELIFGSAEKLRTNVNSDESAVFGAGFRAAEISPSFRVKEIRTADTASYSTGMKWTSAKTQKTQSQQLWTATSHLGAAPKEVTFQNKDDFAIEFYQVIPAADGEGVQSPTKILTTKNLTAAVAVLGEKYSCEPTDIQFKVGLQLSGENGEVLVSKAAVECESDAPEKESIIDGVKNLFGFGKNKDQQPLADGEEAETATAASSETTETSTTTKSTKSTKSKTSTGASSSAAASVAPGTKITVSMPVSYTLAKTGIPQLSTTDVAKIKDRLKAFQASDRARLQREDALNRLEAFTYKVRSLLENDEFIAVSTEAERTALEAASLETSDWLYGDGADAPLDALQAKHAALEKLAGPIESRITEHAQRPGLVAGIKEALEQSKSFVASIRQRIEEYESYQAAKAAAATEATKDATDAKDAKEAKDASSSTGDAFDGLEDDEPVVVSEKDTEAEAEADTGPVPPMYKIEDLAESEALYTSVSAWLAQQEEAQAQLNVKEDPVLTVKELKAKRDALDKAGMDLAMKGMRNFDYPKPKGKGSKAKSSTKPKSGKTYKAKPRTTATSATPDSKPTGAGAADEQIKHEEL